MASDLPLNGKFVESPTADSGQGVVFWSTATGFVLVFLLFLAWMFTNLGGTTVSNNVDDFGIGGAALIAPMLIMTLHQTKLTSLLTTSLFVVAVAVALACWMEDGTSIVGATAAYAAVLVVFVGAVMNTTG